jgi:protein-disulfide isomerase
MTEEVKEDFSNNSENNKPKRDYLLPASILISALLVSGSLVYNAGKKAAPADLKETARVGQPTTLKIRPVGKDDHILGNYNAPVKIVEYSDLECPFCKRFHPVLKQILSDYGDKVAWVYRHFPLDSLHPKARKEAEAAECAAELGGNEKFWAYIDRLFEVTPSNNGLDLAELPQIAADVGLDRNRFEDCLQSGKYANKVDNDFKDGLAAGVTGTPTSIVISKDGTKIPINGALPLNQVKLIIDQALGQ